MKGDPFTRKGCIKMASTWLFAILALVSCAVPAVPTAMPPTAAAPTVTPTPRIAPTKFVRHSSIDVVNAFTQAGLECANTHGMTKDDYGPAPMYAMEGTRFFIPSLCETCGGRIMAFADQQGLTKTQAYYVELGKGSGLLFSWVYVKDNILVQINGDLPAEQAAKYEAALQTLK